MSTSVHKRGEGVKNRQNLVHVVIEWPLDLFFCFFPCMKWGPYEMIASVNQMAKILVHFRESKKFLGGHFLRDKAL